MYPRVAGLLLVASYFFFQSVSAETMRCAGRIVQAGMSQSDVLQLCGEPDERVTLNENKWIYRGEGNAGDTDVHFYGNGDVEKIDSDRTVD